MIAEQVSKHDLNIFFLNGVPYIYSNGYYKKDTAGILKEHIKGYMYQEIITARRLKDVYELMQQDAVLHKENDEINQYPATWINFRNGMYDPVNKVMRPHDPKYLSINQVPHDFDEKAEYAGTVAEQFFNNLIPDPADRRMYYAYTGYCMTRDTSFQKFLVIVGAPGTGKSTGINMTIDAVGWENVVTVTLQGLGERFASADLLGKLLNACADLPKKAMEQVDVIKRITGEDPVEGEYKHGARFKFRSYAKLLFSANQMPNTYDEKTEAFFRRLLMIDIRKKGPHIENLKEGLAYSMPGFIKTCVDALSDVYAAGKGLDSPNSKDLVLEYYKATDSVKAFLCDCTERAEGQRIKRSDLYDQYTRYCMTEGRQTLGKNSFYRDVISKGFREGPSHGNHVFYDLQLKKTSPVGEFFPVDFHQEEIPFFKGN